MVWCGYNSVLSPLADGTTAAETVDQRVPRFRPHADAAGSWPTSSPPLRTPRGPHDAVGAFTLHMSQLSRPPSSDPTPNLPWARPYKSPAGDVSSSRPTSSAPPLLLSPGSQLCLHATPPHESQPLLPDPASSPPPPPAVRPSMAAASSATSVHDFTVKVSPVPLVAFSSTQKTFRCVDSRGDRIIGPSNISHGALA